MTCGGRIKFEPQPRQVIAWVCIGLRWALAVAMATIKSSCSPPGDGPGSPRCVVAVLTDQRHPIWGEDHARAAAGAVEGTRIRLDHLRLARRADAVGIDNLIRLEPPVQDCQLAPGAGIPQVVRQDLFQVVRAVSLGSSLTSESQ